MTEGVSKGEWRKTATCPTARQTNSWYSDSWKKKEMLTNSIRWKHWWVAPVFRACLLVVPAFFSAAEASARRAGDAVMTQSVAIHPSPGASRAGPVIAEGSVVRVVRTDGKWTQIATEAAGIGWVSYDAVVHVSLFRRLSEWGHPGSVEVGDGDYSASYSFKSDGSFVVTETVQDPDESYRFVKRRGKVYAYHGIVWARIGEQAPDTGRMFFEKGKTLCWQGYLDGRCP